MTSAALIGWYFCIGTLVTSGLVLHVCRTNDSFRLFPWWAWFVAMLVLTPVWPLLLILAIDDHRSGRL